MFEDVEVMIPTWIAVILCFALLPVLVVTEFRALDAWDERRKQ